MPWARNHLALGYRQCKLYICSARPSARLHPTRLPWALSFFARARVASNVASARSSARLTERGVGW